MRCLKAWTHILVEIGKSSVGSSRACCTLHRTFQIPNPDGQGSTLHLCREFPRSENRRFKCRGSLLPQTPERRNPDLTLWCHVYPIIARGSSCHVATGISPIANPKCKVFWCRKPRNAELRYAGSDATCPSVDRRLPLLREIATRDFEEFNPLVL